MLISVENLPSKGFGATGINIVNMTPPTYEEILNYVSGADYKPNSIGQLRWDMENLIHGKVTGYESLSAYDLNFIISMRKLLALLDKNKVTISGKTYSTSEISFTTISDEIMKVYKVNGNKFHMPNIAEVENKLYGIDTRYYDLPMELLLVAIGMGISLEELLSFGTDMLATIEHLKSLIVTQPRIEGGEEDIVLFGKSSDLFQDILHSQDTDSFKIEFAEEQES